MKVDQVTPPKREPSPPTPVKVSFVITGKDVERYVQSCLSSILVQAETPGFEVIYTDGGSTDKSVSLVSRMSETAEVPLSIVSEIDGKTVAYGRNVGLARARGDIVAFVDADCVIPLSWLRSALDHLDASDNEQLVAVGGGYLPDPTSPFLNRLIYFSLSTLLGSGGSSQFRYVTRERYTKSLPGGNVAYKRHAVTSTGSFDSRLNFCEDYDLNSRLLKRGFKILVEPGLYSVHRKEYTMSSLPKSMFTYGKGRAESIRLVGKRLLTAQVALLIAYLVILPVVSFILLGLSYVVALILLFSAIVMTYFGTEIRRYPSLSRKEKIVTVLLWPCVAALILFSHISYVAGFIFGSLRTSRRGRTLS